MTSKTKMAIKENTRNWRSHEDSINQGTDQDENLFSVDETIYSLSYILGPQISSYLIADKIYSNVSGIFKYPCGGSCNPDHIC